ncbi:DNA repair protein RecN [Hydrogenophaga soli]
MSLLRIALKDFVIVPHLDLDLAQGFTALTGETGAGKSILIDALQLALGGRADPTVVRAGQDKADITAEFQLTPDVAEWLTAQDLDASESTVLLRRTVDTQGRSKGWINGTPASATQLRELGGWLVDIHGQHAWQALTRPDSTRALLDGYARIDTTEIASLWRQWKDATAALLESQQAAGERQLQREKLSWQVAELDKLQPRPNEWDALQAEHLKLAHVHSLLEAAEQASQCLVDAEVNALDLVNRATQSLAAREHLEPEFTRLRQLLDQAQVLQQEAARDLHAYSRRTEADPQRLNQLDQRLSQWMALAKRMACAPEALASTHVRLREQLQALDSASDTEQLTQRVDACYQKLMGKCKEISNLRLEYKDILAMEISNKMQDLGMNGGVFEVVLNPLTQPQSTGMETVEFRVAGHAGVEPRPIAKVASGGELSRISLAIAVSTSRVRGCPTLIFDEVDSGVGGAVAHTVGQLMADLGQHRQVLAVTHLPQVAACAHHHLRVTKAEQLGHVRSQVEPLTPEQRVDEIARMLGGAVVTDTTRAHAREMLSA